MQGPRSCSQHVTERLKTRDVQLQEALAAAPPASPWQLHSKDLTELLTAAASVCFHFTHFSWKKKRRMLMSHLQSTHISQADDHLLFTATVKGLLAEGSACAIQGCASRA